METVMNIIMNVCTLYVVTCYCIYMYNIMYGVCTV